MESMSDKERAEVEATIRQLIDEHNADPDGITNGYYRCLSCKKYPLYRVHDRAVAEGHIYSKNGVNEFGISYICEFCFDSVTAEPEDGSDEV